MYRVLLVEDEEIIRKGIRYSVPWEECGCSVVGEAENGAVGEEKIAELQPDIVITDITMPVKSGLEMIADTREKFKYCHHPDRLLGVRVRPAGHSERRIGLCAQTPRHGRDAYCAGEGCPPCGR